jgi:hypothetical protein
MNSMAFAMDARDREESMKEVSCQNFKEVHVYVYVYVYVYVCVYVYVHIQNKNFMPVCIAAFTTMNSGSSMGIVDLCFDSVVPVMSNIGRRLRGFGFRQLAADQSTTIC